MAKDISSSGTKIKKPFLTDSVKRLTIINIAIFFLLLLMFNILLISFIYYIAHRNMDQRISHEIENIINTLEITGDNISVADSSELKESDLYEITESPYFLQIFNNDGKVILTSRNVELFKPLPFRAISDDQLIFESFTFENIRFRSGYIPMKDSSGARIATLQLSVYERNFRAVMSELIIFNALAVIFFLLVVIIASLIAAKKTFKPINEIIATAESYNVQNLNKRIEVDAKPSDEIGRLRDTLNKLFDRIEDYVVEITYFSDHASHQLMNPLTAIRTEIEYLLKKERPVSEYREALTLLSEQTDNMISIVKTLLVIAKSGKLKNESKTIFSLTALIKKEVYNTFKDQKIIYNIDENLYLRGESEKYLMVLENLIHNSIKYSPDMGDITVTAKKNGGNIILSVEDKGIGIEDSEKGNIFQKFYRSQSAEKLGIKGFGLGLSLVKSIVDEVSGTIEIIDNKPNGVIFKLVLPALELG